MRESEIAELATKARAERINLGWDAHDVYDGAPVDDTAEFIEACDPVTVMRMCAVIYEARRALQDTLPNHDNIRRSKLRHALQVFDSNSDQHSEGQK